MPLDFNPSWVYIYKQDDLELGRHCMNDTKIVPAHIIDFFEKLEEIEKQKQENRIYAELPTIPYWHQKEEKKEEEQDVYIPLR